MSQLAASDLRKGMLVEVDGRPNSIVFWNIWKSDRRSRIQMRFKDILNGRTSEATAQPDDRYAVLAHETVELEHSYRDGPEEVFYSRDGEEWRVAADLVEETLAWQAPSYRGMVVDGRLLAVNPPAFVAALVTETEPAVKGVGSGLKDALLENGMRVKVGMNVNVGDRVRIDTDTMEYRERVTA